MSSYNTASCNSATVWYITVVCMHSTSHSNFNLLYMSYVTLALNEIDELHSTIELQNDANFFEKYMHANTAETILSNFEYVQKC